MRPKTWVPVFSLLYAATFWGLIWYPLRLLEGAGMAGVWQTFVSYLTALVVSLPFVRWPADWRVDWRTLILLALSTGWCNLAFVLAMLDGVVVRVLLLFYLSPVWAVLFGRWLLRERVSRTAWGLLVLAMGGTLLMLWHPDVGWPWPPDRADLLALSSGVAFALSNVAVRKLHHADLGVKIVSAWAGAALVAGMAILVTTTPLPQSSAVAWSGAALLGVPGIFLATLALQYGVTHMAVQRSSVILLFEIIVGAVSAAWLALEILQWREFVGGALIMIAGYGMARGNARHEITGGEGSPR